MVSFPQVLGLAFCLSCLVSAVPFDQPIQLVQPLEGHSGLKITDGVAQMAALNDTKIALISVVGPYHSGKSFLMNALLGHSNVFKVGPETSPQTRGIWVCRTRYSTMDGAEVWLLDSEGFFGPKVSESYDARLFTLSALVASELVYNTIKVIDQQAVNLLESLVRQAQLFKVRNVATTEGEEDESSSLVPDFLKTENFPPLTWVVEDFVQNVDGGKGWVEGSKGVKGGEALLAYLKSYLSDGQEHLLDKLFPDINVHTLFLPARQQDQLRDLSQVPWEGLTEEFKTEVTALRQRLLQRVRSRPFSPTQDFTSCKQMAQVLQFVATGLSKGLFHELPSLWQAWHAQVSEVSLSDASSLHARLLGKAFQENVKSPPPFKKAEKGVLEARERTISYFRALTEDLSSAEDEAKMEVLGKKIEKKEEEGWEAYRGRVVEHVKSLKKQHLRSFILKIDNFLLDRLPVEPESLEKKCSEELKAEIKAFSLIFEEFSSGLSRQSFEILPSEELKSEILQISEERKKSNFDALQKKLEIAVKNSEELLEGKIKKLENDKKMFGEKKLKNVTIELLNETKKTFENNFSKNEKLNFLKKENYKSIVEPFRFQLENSADSKIDNFINFHEKILKNFFLNIFEKSLNVYRGLRRDLELSMLPADDKILEGKHSEIMEKARGEMLEMAAKEGEELKESEFFSDNLKQLFEIGGQEFKKMEAKNIELWKVHSDEATSCAIQKNSKFTVENCPFKLFCFFKLFPISHRSTSRAHIRECFQKIEKNQKISQGGRGGGGGLLVSESMQEKIFESFYEKDLAREAAEVSSNLIYISTFLFLILGILYFMPRRGEEFVYVNRPSTGRPSPLNSPGYAPSTPFLPPSGGGEGYGYGLGGAGKRLSGAGEGRGRGSDVPPSGRQTDHIRYR